MRGMDETYYRRGKVTPENKEEARRLKELWDARRPKMDTGRPMSQELFGQLYDIGGQAVVGFFLHGKTALSQKAADGFARGLNCSVEDFSPRLARPTVVMWPFPRVKQDRWDACDNEDRAYVQAAINHALDECEQHRREQVPGKPSKQHAA